MMQSYSYMKFLLTSLSVFLFAIGTFAQDFVQVTYGPSYTSHTFYRLSDDNQVTVENGLWDIALTATGLQDAGLHINEATASMANEVELYVAPSNDFDDDVDIAQLTIRLYNEDITWNYGAFNSLRDVSKPLDYGWGSYDPVSRRVVGNEVFVIKMRNGQYKKFEVQDLNLTTYNLRWADLDGQNEVTMAINKADYDSEDLILLSIQDEKVYQGVQPFDLLFTRYVSPLDDGNGGLLDYTISGVLHAPGVQVAQTDSMDPNTVKFEDFKNSLDAQIDVIGFDWKDFDLTALQWKITEDRAYFVKDIDDIVWKVIFIDFEGSQTGNAVFTKEEVGMISSTGEVVGLSGMLISPNPANDVVNVLIESIKPMEITLSIIDMMGKIVYTNDLDVNAGFINKQIDVRQFQSGMYVLSLSNDTGTTTTQLIVE